MAIAHLPDERKKWIFLSREGSAIAPSGNTLILKYTPDKQAKLVEVMLEAPRATRFIVKAGDKIKRYRLAAAGMILDARTFDDPILWWSANQALEIRTAPGASGAAGEVFSASINVWKLQP